MEKKHQGDKHPSQQANVHPETQQEVRHGVADHNSSKVSTHKRQRDARTGHDKDANEAQAGTGKGRG